MKLVVPFNWDFELIDKLEEYPVYMYYAKLQEDVIGGGRTPRSLQTVSKLSVKSAIDKMHSKQIKFNYLLNSLCLGNMEFDKDKRRQIFDLLEWLCELEVDCVTISNPYLAKIISKNFVNLKMACSIFTRIKSLRDAIQWDDLGVDIITLDYPVIRDFTLLENIVNSISAKVQLIANNVCLLNCPYAVYHGESLGHSSQLEYPFSEFISVCRYYCRRDLYNKPEEIIKAGWIRPEDLSFYENIGVDIFKFTDRIKPSWWIERTVKAYANRKYEGNLLELFGSFKLAQNPLTKLSDTRINSLSDYSKRDINASFDLNVQLDNNKLNGFLNHFFEWNCRDRSCNECNYCNGISNEVISFNIAEQQLATTNLSLLIDKIISSNFE